MSLRSMFFLSVLLIGCAADVAVAVEFYIPNDAGGQIRLTDEKCNSSTLRAYAYTLEGHVIYGCWIYKDDMVHVHWPGGDMRVYPAGLFKSNEGK